MTETELIKNLANSLKPKTPIESTPRLLLRWSLICLTCLVVGVSWLGFREDLFRETLDPRYILSNTLIALGTLGAATASLTWSVPGRSLGKLKTVLCFAPHILWMGMVSLDFVLRPESSTHTSSFGGLCASEIFLFALIPALLLFGVVKRGAVLSKEKTGLAVVLASSGVGALAVQFTCHNNSPVHLLLWHVLPVVTFGALGLWIGKKFLPKI